jgi:hypothetical protein
MDTSPEQNNSAIARQLANEHAARTGLSFSESWSIIRNSRPELFGLVTNRESRTADTRFDTILNRQHEDIAEDQAAGMSVCEREHQKVLNTAAARENATPTDEPLAEGFLHDAVREYQQKHSIASFAEAWTTLRNRRPGLFPS